MANSKKKVSMPDNPPDVVRGVPNFGVDREADDSVDGYNDDA